MRKLLPCALYVSCFAVLLGASVPPAQAISVVINNGLTNEIKDVTYASDSVYVRNVGCPPGWPAGFAADPCASPGAATEVEVVSDGVVKDLFAYDTSTVTMSGGDVWQDLFAYDTSTVTMSGGVVLDGLAALDTSTVTMSGGQVQYYLAAGDSSTVTMSGGVVGGGPGRRRTLHHHPHWQRLHGRRRACAVR